ncbi:hypothetical protein W02_12740 [Nitrospira sp. KM1]|nr:hypothetical protein W02_12740 [Nitrospira sp. KM1]
MGGTDYRHHEIEYKGRSQHRYRADDYSSSHGYRKRKHGAKAETEKDEADIAKSKSVQNRKNETY